MASICDYCRSACPENAVKCENCGAPVASGAAPLPDFRRCPYCSRKLLSLASPTCNYCGKRLPDNYIKAHEDDLRRIGELGLGVDKPDANQVIAEVIRKQVGDTRARLRAAFNLFNLADVLIDLPDLFR